MSSTAVATPTQVPMTEDELRDVLPAKMKKSVNPTLIAQINKTLADPELYESYRDNLLGYAHVVKEGKFKIDQYLSAVMYVSYKLMGKTNIEAYSLTFPDKIKRFTAQNVASKDVASYVSAYNKSKLVALLLEQTMIPSWVLNQDLFQEALNEQAVLMRTANSEKVRSDAANSLLTHLKPPEAAKLELDVTVGEDSSITALREATLELVAQQRKLLEGGGATAKEVAGSTIIEGEADEVE